MLHFDSDYMEGMSPAILKRMEEINLTQNVGYGLDGISESARDRIRKACGITEGDVFFLSGGTQTNAIVIKCLLKPYEGVIAAHTGHVSIHEAGAIEAGGHKVLEIEGHDGKLKAEDVKEYVENFYADGNHDHMVKPGMVYISHPTEYGTLYTKEELEALSEVCRKYDMKLYLDGARLAYGLAADPEVSLELIAKNCDVFYIGGTKCGGMFGEALVFPNWSIPGFFTMIKQNGALMAKGWFMGLQFDELFQNDLYYKNGRHGVDLAMKIRRGFEEKGYEMYLDSPTNQQFVVLGDEKMQELQEKVSFGFWEKKDESHTVVRFAAGWATKKEDVEELLNLI